MRFAIERSALVTAVAPLKNVTRVRGSRTDRHGRGRREPVDRILDLASRGLDQYACFEDAADAVYMHVIGAKQLAEWSLQ